MLGCCCGPPPPPPCSITVHLAYRNSDGTMGSGISGATVTITGVTGGPFSGTTDGSGNYTSPTFSGGSGTLTVTYGGCSFTESVSIANCGTINLCYCKTVTTVSVAGPGDGAVTLTENGNPCTDGATTEIGVVSKSGTTWTFTLCNISQCESYFVIPSVTFQACSTDPGWVCACATVHPSCGSDSSLTLTLYYWLTCYNNITSPPAGTATVDWGCCTPQCVNPAQPYGYYPKAIQVRFNSNYGHFASDSGVWITLTLISDTVTVSPTTGQPCRTLIWDSGCRGAQGNYISLPSGQLNHVATGDTSQVFFGSTSQRITTTCCYGDHSGRNISVLQYNRWHNSGCTPYSGGVQPTDHIDTYGATCGDPGTCWGGAIGGTCWPVNASYTLLDATFGGVHDLDTVDVRELACTSAITPVVTGPIGT